METLKPLVDQLTKMLHDGLDLVNGQLPEIATQILAYGAWSCRFWMRIWLCIFIFALALFIFGLRLNDYIPVAAIGCFFMVASIVFSLLCYSELKEIELQSKVYLIKIIAGIIETK